MNNKTRSHRSTRLQNVILRLLAGVCAGSLWLASAIAAPPTPPDTPFGVGFSMANYPNSTIDDLRDTMGLAATVGSHISYVWSWNRQASIAFLVNAIPVADIFSLKTVFQVAPTALGDPNPPAGYVESFADRATRQKYLDDVALFARLKPDYMNLCAEINLMYHFNNAEFENYRSLYSEAYDLVKSISPDTKVGVSLLHSLWVGYAQYDIVYQLDINRVDFIGFTTYPGQRFYDGEFGISSVADFPKEWYSIIRIVYPDKPILFTEIGWSSEIISDPVEQAEFVAALPRLFSDVQPELVTWTLLHETSFFDPANLDQDALDFLAMVGVDPEVLFNRFNGMGLINNDGLPKPAWVEALHLDFSAPAP